MTYHQELQRRIVEVEFRQAAYDEIDKKIYEDGKEAAIFFDKKDLENLHLASINLKKAVDALASLTSFLFNNMEYMGQEFPENSNL